MEAVEQYVVDERWARRLMRRGRMVLFNNADGVALRCLKLERVRQQITAAKAHAKFSKLTKQIDDSTWELEFSYLTDAAKTITVTLMIFDMGADGQRGAEI